MKKLLTLSCAVLGFLFSNAQTHQPLIQYGFDVIPSSLTLNPAFQAEKPIFIGVPVLGGIHLSTFSTDLTFRDIIKRESNTRTVVDVNNISSLVEDNSYINTQFSTDVLLGGLRAYNGGYWSFGFKINTEVDIRLSNDMTDFLLYGNFNDRVYNKWLDFSEFRLTSQVYSNLHVGYSKDLNKRVRVGGRLNILSGLVYAGVTDNSLELITNKDGAPVPNTIETKGVLEMSTAGIDDSGEETEVSFSPFNFGNLGVGIDLGIDYMLNKKVYLSASATDIGFIRWTDNAQAVGINVPGTWKYEGFTYEPNDDYSIGDRIDDWTDNLEDDLGFDTVDNSSFTTYLQSKLFLSGKYRFNKKYSANLTFKGELDRGGIEPAVSLGLQAKVTRFLDLVAATSYQDNQVGIGAGLNLSIGPFNWYILTDNIGAIVAPATTHGTNFSMGMNVQLGKEKSNAQYGRTRWSENEKADKKKISAKMKKDRLKKKKKKEKATAKAQSNKEKDKTKKSSSKTKAKKKKKTKKSKDSVKKRTKSKKKKNVL